MMTNPVFIVGMPRSGTTLLRLMLNSHSKIAISTETHYFTHFKMELFKRKRFFNHWAGAKTLVRLNRHMPSAVTKMIDLGFGEQGIMDVLKDYRFFKQSGLDTSRIEEHLTDGHKPYYNVYNAWLVSYAQRFSKDIFGDKTPVNGLFIKEILALYPGANIINVIRNPFEVMASLNKVPWGVGKRKRNYFKKNIELWKRINSNLFQCRTCMNVLFEDLVSGRMEDTTEEMKKICRYLRVEFEEDVLHPEKCAAQYLEKDEEWKTNNLKPLNREHITSNKSQLTAEEVRMIKDKLGGFVHSHGELARYRADF